MSNELPSSTPAQPRSRTGCWGALVLIFLIVAALAAYIFHRIESWPGRAAQEVRRLVAEVTGFHPRVMVDSRVVFEQTEEILQLATVSRPTEVERELEHQRFGSTKRLKLRGTYEVKAGFDLKKPFNVRITDRRVILEVSPPKILSVDQKDIEILAHENGLWNKIQPQEMEDELRSLPTLARFKASETGIQKEALEVLTKQLREKLGTDYNVEIQVLNAGAEIPERKD